MSDKPLHVQVAEALGCCPTKGEEGVLFCGRRSCDQEDLPEYHPIPHYDTDWAVTGPLIEKYGIELRDGDGDWSAGAWRPRKNCVKHLMASGRTPLEATCRLILRLVVWKGLDVDATPEEP